MDFCQEKLSTGFTPLLVLQALELANSLLATCPENLCIGLIPNVVWKVPFAVLAWSQLKLATEHPATLTCAGAHFVK